MAYALLVAGKGGLRSRLAREAAEALARRGVRVGGFVQRTLEGEQGQTTVEADRLPEGGTVTVARPGPPSAEQGAPCVLFQPAALAEVRRWVDEDARRAQVLVVDGLGKVELGGAGHRSTLEHALAAAPLVVLPVREDHLVYAMEQLHLDDPVAAFTDGEGPAAFEAFVAAVVDAARR